MEKNYFVFLFTFIMISGYSQVGINTTDPSAASVLHIKSSNDGTNYGGFLPPRVSLSERAQIPVTATDDGMMVYLQEGDTRCVQIWNGVDLQWEDVYCMPVSPSGPSLLGIQNFEAVPATPTLTLFENNSGTYQTGNGSYPNSAKYVSPVRGYGKSNGNVDIDLGPVDASAYTDATLILRLASFSGTSGNGADSGDYVDIYISTDGGSTYSYELGIKGNGNARWDFNATGNVSITYDGDNTAFSYSPSSGGTIANGPSTIEINGLPNSTDLLVGIVMYNNNSDETWVIDDVELYGN